MVETVITTIEDEFNYYVKKYFPSKEILVLVVCLITFCLCIPNLCPVSKFLHKRIIENHQLIYKSYLKKGWNLLFYNS